MESHLHVIYMQRDWKWCHILPGNNDKWKVLHTVGITWISFLCRGPLMEYFSLIRVTKCPVLHFSEAKILSDIREGKALLYHMHECMEQNGFGIWTQDLLEPNNQLYTRTKDLCTINTACVMSVKTAFHHLLFLAWTCVRDFHQQLWCVYIKLLLWP